MYTWLQNNFLSNLKNKYQDLIDSGELTTEEAHQAFQEEFEDWQNGYGDYMHDVKGDR